MAVVFIWAMKAAFESRQYAWAQSEAVASSQKLVAYMRNATDIHAIGLSGDWIELSMPPSGTVSRISYQNPSLEPGAGVLAFVADTGDPLSPTNVVAEGVTKVMTFPVRNVFEKTGANSLRLAYRITRTTQRGTFSAEVDTGVRLRNN
jgi:hypothetical protein